ncbi:hypothetical protein DPMN_098032 [Dreissena polymorpha]|uniref:Uncharacterized protein n=1 Tax=Dreissena polymorpha TaxID=45954 RepID=A0A9D4R6W6_DREPO|nr:hypothetical protein DPMN_098032 [Dreissena polymorpha]
MNLQAKAEVINMVPHNGEYACLTCENPGKVFKQGKGRCRAFPLLKAPTRTSSSILQNAEEALITSKHVKGLKSVSVLFDIYNFEHEKALFPEYMHGVLLGTTKKLMTVVS